MQSQQQGHHGIVQSSHPSFPICKQSALELRLLQHDNVKKEAHDEDRG